MTRDKAIEIVIAAGSRVIDRLRDDRPQRLCDELEVKSAEDSVDILIALGLLKVDAPCPQENASE